MNRPRLLLAGLLLLLLPVLAACVGVQEPEGWASPAFTDDTAYYFVDSDRLAAVALDPSGGARVRWTFPRDDADEKRAKLRAVYGQPVVDGDRLYIADYDRGLIAVNRADGALLWTQKGIEGRVVAGIAAGGDRLFIGTTDGKLYAVNKADGSAADGWPAKGISFTKGVWATPVVAGDRVFVATMGGEVHALSLTDGSAVWARPFEANGAVASLARLDETRLFVPSFDHYVYAVDMADGTVSARFKVGDWVWMEPAIADGAVYFADIRGEVYALDITTFQSLWPSPYATGARAKSTPVIVGGMLVIADREPVVHFVDLHDGKRLNSVPLADTGKIRAGLVVRDRLAYAVTTDGDLWQLDPAQLTAVELQIAGANQ